MKRMALALKLRLNLLLTSLKNFGKLTRANLFSIPCRISYSIRWTKLGLKNLRAWLPIIWVDRHWDYDYLLTIIDKKLELMQENFASEKAQQHHNTKPNLRTMKRLRDLLALSRNDFDLEDDCSPRLKARMKAHVERWGEVEWKTTPIEGEQGVTSIKLEFVYPKAKNEREQNLAKKQRTAIIEARRKESEKAWENLWKLMQKEMRSLWW
jgi:hypothetical protein